LHDADAETAENVDDGDENGGDGVTANEFAGAIHRSIKIRFLLDFAPASTGLFFGDDASAEFGVDGHLFAGHGVQSETRGDFGDTTGALGDDDEIDENEDRENYEADDVVAADDKTSE